MGNVSLERIDLDPFVEARRSERAQGGVVFVAGIPALFLHGDFLLVGVREFGLLEELV